MLQHQRSRTRERSPKCELSDKSFPDASQPSQNTRIQTGERPYKSELSDESFSDVSQLTLDTSIQTRERPYSCELSNESDPGSAVDTVFLQYKEMKDDTSNLSIKQENIDL